MKRRTAAIAGLLLITTNAAQGAFVDVTPSSMAASLSRFGAAWGDYDSDGDPDLLTGLTVSPFLQLFRNDGGFNFTDVSATAIGTPPGASHIGVSWADYDEDGDLDFMSAGGTGVAGSGIIVLYENDGDGTFSNVTAGGLTSPATAGRTPAWIDADRDGDLDVLLANSDAASPSQAYRNDGGTFIAVSVPSFQVPSTAVVLGDYDNDGDSDAFVAPGFSIGPHNLLRNDGGFAFSNVSVAAGVTGSSALITAGFADFDNDGDLDVAGTDAGDVVTLYRNNGGGTLNDIGPTVFPAANYTRSSAWADFDNDSDVDIYFGGFSSNGDADVLFRNDAGTFVANSTGPLVGSLSTQCSPWADVDLDGDLDLYLSRFASSGVLARNDSPPQSHWLQVKLEGTISNRAGIGARITVVAGGRTIIREVQSGSAFNSVGPLVQHFGLGSATSVTSFTIRWPFGHTQTVAVSGVDRVITVTEPGFTPVASLVLGYQPGQAFDLAVERRGVNVTSATIFFRPAGTATFSAGSTMNIDVAGDRMTAGVASVNATENGIEYFISYRANGGTSRVFPPNGLITPAFLPARLTKTQPTPPGANEYALISIPFAATNASLGGVLEDDLGAYDNTKWRFGRFSPSAGTYLEAGSAGALSAGRGFWLIEKSPIAFDVDGSSQNTVGGTSIAVDPGWNQIGHPYLFNVPTSSVDRSGAPGVANRFVAREGGAYVDKTVLEPWKGYWVFNSGTGTQSIVIPGSIVAPPLAAVSRLEDQLEWGVEVRATSTSSSDLGNFAGVAASMPADELSLPEPPGLPGTVRAYFERSAEDAAEWTTDVREGSAAGESFDLVVEVPEGGTTLSFGGLGTLPAGWGAILVADENLAAVDVNAGEDLRLASSGTSRFRLVIGDAARLAAARTGQDRSPNSVQLAVPHPNPFSGSATIAFALPQPTHVELAVFDVTGRSVRELNSGGMSAGIHRLTWDGRASDGRQLSPGVYFVKLTVGEKSLTEKIVLLQ